MSSGDLRRVVRSSWKVRLMVSRLISKRQRLKKHSRAWPCCSRCSRAWCGWRCGLRYSPKSPRRMPWPDCWRLKPDFGISPARGRVAQHINASMDFGLERDGIDRTVPGALVETHCCGDLARALRRDDIGDRSFVVVEIGSRRSCWRCRPLSPCPTVNPVPTQSCQDKVAPRPP